jgi:hypothetical protein
MILYHATHRRNLDSILDKGLCTRYACTPGMRVWACCKRRIPWAILHAVRRHGGKVEDIVVIRLKPRRKQFQRSSHPGLWNSKTDVHWWQLEPFCSFEEASR